MTPEQKMELICKVVAKEFGLVEPGLLKSAARWTPLAMAKLTVMHIGRNLGLLDREIEGFLGRAHGVVANAWKTMNNVLSTEAKEKARYERIWSAVKTALEK